MVGAMKTADAIEHFGTLQKLADSLGIRRQSVYDWGEEVPELRAYQLQVLTDGALRADGAAPDENGPENAA